MDEELAHLRKEYTRQGLDESELAATPVEQFRRWFSENGEEPLWATVTGVKSPPVLRYRIDPMFDEPLMPLVPELKVARPRQRGGRR